MSASELWWTIRWHIGRIVVGNSTHFVLALREGLEGFRREFSRAFGNRWKASDRTEFRRRWEASR